MLLLGVLAMALVGMLAAPETSAARWLRALLVERTAAWLAKLKPERLIVQGGLLGLAALLLFLVRGTDLGVLIAQMMPEVISWLVAFDVITILEVSLAIWLVATNARVRAAFKQARLAAWRWALRCVAGMRASLAPQYAIARRASVSAKRKSPRRTTTTMQMKLLPSHKCKAGAFNLD